MSEPAFDILALKARSLRAREFSETIEGRSFTLRVPTRHETLVAARSLGGRLSEDLAGLMLLQRALLEGAVVAWSAVTVADLLDVQEPEASQAVPHSREAVLLLLDFKTEWAKTLGNALSDRLQARNAAIETEQKN